MQRILVVDDSRMSRRIAETALSDAGFEVAEAEDGRAALSACFDRQPDCVVTDLLMPGIDGTELVQTGVNQRFPGFFRCGPGWLWRTAHGFFPILKLYF